jgi:hypothetical protein
MPNLIIINYIFVSHFLPHCFVQFFPFSSEHIRYQYIDLISLVRMLLGSNTMDASTNKRNVDDSTYYKSSCDTNCYDFGEKVFENDDRSTIRSDT